MFGFHPDWQKKKFYYLIRMFLDIPKPLGNVVKRFGVGDVVDQHDAHRASVVRRRDGVKSLLSGSVPNLIQK